MPPRLPEAYAQPGEAGVAGGIQPGSSHSPGHRVTPPDCRCCTAVQCPRRRLTPAAIREGGVQRRPIPAPRCPSGRGRGRHERRWQVRHPLLRPHLGELDQREGGSGCKVSACSSFCGGMERTSSAAAVQSDIVCQVQGRDLQVGWGLVPARPRREASAAPDPDSVQHTSMTCSG